MIVKSKKKLLSTCVDSLLELKQFTEVLEQSGYTKDTIDDWSPTTVDGTIHILEKAAEKAYRSGNLPWVVATSKEKFVKKMYGSIFETLWEAIVNSQRFQRILPGQPEFCYHRGDYGIEDLETGSPDKIIRLQDGSFRLVNLKSSADPTKRISPNSVNTHNIFGWREQLKFSDPDHPFVTSEVTFISNVRANDDVIRPTKGSIFGNSGDGSLSQIVDNQLPQFWRDFWNALWETQQGQEDPLVAKFNGLYPDQKKKLYDPINTSISKVLTALCGCGGGKTVVFRELVREDYKKYKISGKGIYGLDFPRLALGSQHNDTFAELDVYATIVNTSANNYKYHFKPSENLQLNTATTDIKKLAKQILNYVYSSQEVPLLLLNTDKGLTRLRKAFEAIKNGDVFLKQDADPKWTYKKVVKMCRQFHHDECHNLVPSADPNLPRKQKTFTKELIKSLLFFNKIFDKSVYWTATKKIDQKGNNKYDMNNIDIFGLVEAEYSFADLIKNGRILPCFTRIVKLELNDYVDLENTKSLTGITDDDEDLTFLVKAIRDHKMWCDSMKLDCQIMFFSKGTQCLPHFKKALEEIFKKEKLYVEYVTAETDQKDRAIRFKNYEKNKFSVLMNYDIIAEGIDIHSTTAVVIGRGMNDIKVVQAASRGIRLLQQDRQALANGKIKVGDEAGWCKPYSWVYLFENEAVAEDGIRVTNVEQVLLDLLDHNMSYGYSFLSGKPRGEGKLPEPNPLDSDPENNNDLEKRLKIKISQNLIDIQNLRKINQLDTSKDDYFVKGLETICQ